MRNKKAFKIFIIDNVPLLLTVLLTHVLFFGALFYIKGIWIGEIFYFSFLVFSMMIIHLSIRYYKNIRVYDKFLLKSEIIDDYWIREPRSTLEKIYNLMINEFILNSGNRETEIKHDRKLQKIMIYRFIHQMKTPLSVLKLICENHRGLDDYKKIKRNLDTIQYNLNQIVDIYRLEDFKSDFVSEKILLINICKDNINSLKDYFIASHIYPKLDIDDSIYVYTDSKWLKLMIHQLLTNAIKYSYYGQTVTIKAIKIENEVQLSIIDEGIGIENADLKNVFELFYVGKNGRNNADSSGIGLYIVKRISDYLGHDLDIKSKVNKGTCITIKFYN